MKLLLAALAIVGVVALIANSPRWETSGPGAHAEPKASAPQIRYPEGWEQRENEKLAAKGSLAKFKSCLDRKKPLMDACLPGCMADPSLIGEAFDACLDRCAWKKFGDHKSPRPALSIPVCAPLLRGPPQ